jgi:hypothetical protein
MKELIKYSYANASFLSINTVDKNTMPKASSTARVKRREANHKLTDSLLVYVPLDRESCAHMGTSLLPVKGCKIQTCFRRPGPLSRERSLSCQTCNVTGPQFFLSDPKDHPILLSLITRKEMLGTYSYPDPHGLKSPSHTGEGSNKKKLKVHENLIYGPTPLLHLSPLSILPTAIGGWILSFLVV